MDSAAFADSGAALDWTAGFQPAVLFGRLEGGGTNGYIRRMDTLITFLTSLGPQHWLVFGLILLIAEMASGTTYLLWPAVAAFLTALVTLTGATSWIADMAIFAVLVIVLTAFGRPIVRRWRNENKADGLNERSKTLIGTRGVITVFANGAGSVKIADTIWRAVSDEALSPGQTVVIDSVDGATLKVKAAAT